MATKTNSQSLSVGIIGTGAWESALHSTRTVRSRGYIIEAAVQT